MIRNRHTGEPNSFYIGTSILIVVFFFVLSTGLYAQEMQFQRERDAFALSAKQLFDKEGNPFLKVTVSVPYKKLVFFKRNGRFEAGYRVVVELEDKHGNHIYGDVWEKEVVVDDFRTSTSSRLHSSITRKIPAKPGENILLVTLDVIGTSRRLSVKREITILSGSKKGLGISSPVFFAPVNGNPPPRGKIVIINIADETDEFRYELVSRATYTGLNQWVRAEYSIVAPTLSRGDTLFFYASVKDSKGKLLLYARKSIVINGSGYRHIAVELDSRNMPLGMYSISAVVATEANRLRSNAEGTFTVVLNRALFSRYYHQLIEIVSAIANDRDVERFRNAPDSLAGRLEVWEKFWRKRDPTPSTEANENYTEFIERLVFVVRHFSINRPGWETDRGRIYLANGHPDRIAERQGTTLGLYYMYWYYYSLGVVYIFEDSMGNGDYKLIATRML